MKKSHKLLIYMLVDTLGVTCARAIRSYGAGIRREGRYTLLSLTREAFVKNFDSGINRCFFE